jgi:hypothetical protein
MLKDDNIKIIDNVVDQEHFSHLKNVMWSNQFPWFMSDGYATTSAEQLELGFKFTHNFYHEHNTRSQFFDLLTPLLNIMQPKAFLRIQGVVTPRADKLIKTGYHRDAINCVTAIYYLNTTNGNLHFEDGSEVETLENRLVIFNSNLQHCGTKCTDSDRRTLINFNYYERQEGDNEFKF